MCLFTRAADLAVSADLCPWARVWIDRRHRPLWALAGTLMAAVACGVFVRTDALLAAAAVAAVGGVGLVWPALTLLGIRGELHMHDARIREGEPTLVTLRLVSRLPWPAWGIGVELDLGCSAGATVSRIGAWSTASYTWEVRPGCRGEYPVTPPRLVTGFPFGLRVARREVTVGRRLLVWPSILPCTTLADAAETRPVDDIHGPLRIGDGGDMAGTRPFREGDSLRRVHWAQTARLGALVVCEREAPVTTAVRVVFDSDQSVHGCSGPQGTLEWSIRFAASICAAYHAQNARVECCFGHETIAVANGAAGMRRFLDELARFRPCQHVDRGCQHEHAHHDCRRIHHRDCGTFQITITTARGIGTRTEHRHVHGDQVWLVLDDAAADAQLQRPPGRLVRIPWDDDPVHGFQRAWRSLCHAL